MTKGRKTTLITLFLIVIIALAFLYRYSPYKLEYLGHYNKIWAHRVNSKEKLKSALNYFDGVELDLEYDEIKDLLDVNHPPTESINLSFEEYILEIPENFEPYLWLDIKNLNSNHSENILKKLLEIFSERNYPLEKVLVETRNPEVLPAFENAGFKTSFYLPPGISKFEKSEKEHAINTIKSVLAKQPNLAISSNYEDYELMSTYFPTTKKYVWIINSVRIHGFSQPIKILTDSTIKVVLISYKALGGNR